LKLLKESLTHTLFIYLMMMKLMMLCSWSSSIDTRGFPRQ
jgi:hypothetical protein